MRYISRISSPMGKLTVASDGENITGLWMEGQKYYASTMDGSEVEQEVSVAKCVRQWLDCYFSGIEPDFCPPLAPEGSEFRRSVWKLLCDIPYGQLTTYGNLAKQMEAQTGKHQSGQAIGGAVGHNPISILIPCHRVVGVTGSLTGYAGGLDKKIQLLTLEKAPMDRLFIPKRGTALSI